MTREREVNRSQLRTTAVILSDPIADAYLHYKLYAHRCTDCPLLSDKTLHYPEFCTGRSYEVLNGERHWCVTFP